METHDLDIRWDQVHGQHLIDYSCNSRQAILYDILSGKCQGLEFSKHVILLMLGGR